MIGVGTMVANMLYFNQVERTRHWYTQSNMTTVVEVRYVLLTGFQLQPISSKTNKLPTACNRKDAAQKKAVKVMLLDHEVIMEEAGKRNRLEYDVNNDDDSDESKEESEEESESGDGEEWQSTNS